jgi:exodeoxyribonuclease VII small subunit
MELEEIMDKLENTVHKMEQEKLSLEESYQCFSEGMKYVREGNRAIDRVEKKIQVLMEENGEEQEDE